MTYQGQTVTVQLPEPIFRRLRHIAELTDRSVEDLLATTVDAALPQTPDLPDEVAFELAAMTTFSDEALRAVAEPALSPAQQRRLSELSHLGGTRTLTDDEATELEQLLDVYDRSVLRRAKALAILAQRGFALPDGIEPSGTLDARS